MHPAEVLGAAVAMLDGDWPEVAVHVGSGDGKLLAALMHQGYTAFGISDGVHSVDFGPGASERPLAVTPGELLPEAADMTQHMDFLGPTFTAVSPPTASVVVALDVAQLLPSLEQAQRFVGALTAGRPRLVVFSAATPGEGAIRGVTGGFPLELRAKAWLEMFQARGFVFAAAATIECRNALLLEMTSLASSFWLAKNLMAFVPAPAPHSKPASDMEIQRMALIDAEGGNTVRWFTIDDTLPAGPLRSLLVADALDYQDLVRAPLLPGAGSTPPAAAAGTHGQDGVAASAAQPPLLQRPAVQLPSATSATGVADAAAAPAAPAALGLSADATKASRLKSLADLTSDKELLLMYTSGAHNELHEALLSDLEAFVTALPTDVRIIDRWMATFLFLMSRPDFNVVQVAHGARYLQRVELLAHMVRVSNHRTTDAVLNALSSNPRAMVQMLALYTPFNELEISPVQLWPSRSLYADVWYGELMQLSLSGALANAGFFTRMRRLTLDMLQLKPDGSDVPNPAAVGSFWHKYEYYFTVSYILPDDEGAVKHIMNRHFQSLPVLALRSPDAGPDVGVAPAPAPAPAPTGDRILVVCAQWKVGHSVHRNFFQYVAALQQAFNVTLLFLESDQIKRHLMDTTGFDAVHVLSRNASGTDVADMAWWIKSQAFDAVFYPQLGMHATDVVFANQRLSPVQVTSYGHSSSTHGALIDYFVGGEEVEVWEPTHGHLRYRDRPPRQALLENPQRRYSERLVLVPGMGVIFNPVPFDRPPLDAVDLMKTDKALVINCAWTVTKVNAAHLKVLARIVETVQRQSHKPRRLHFRFYAGVKANTQPLAMAALQVELARALRLQEYEKGVVTVEVPPGLGYNNYLGSLATGHLALDSFPFGGCNTVMDSLFASVPIVALAGNMWRNRIGPAMLFRLGLDDLVAHTEDAYVNRAVELIINAKQRHKATERVAAVRVPAAVVLCVCVCVCVCDCVCVAVVFLLVCCVYVARFRRFFLLQADLSPLSNTTEAAVYVELFRRLIDLNGTTWEAVGGPEADNSHEAEVLAHDGDAVAAADGVGSKHEEEEDPTPARLATRQAQADMRRRAAVSKLEIGLKNDFGGPLRSGNPIFCC